MGCEKEVSRTAPGRLDKHNQPHWNAESFLLPLPENTDDVGLRLEVWTTTCHGQASSKARIFCASASPILISELSELQDINSPHTGQSDLLQRDSIDAEK